MHFFMAVNACSHDLKDCARFSRVLHVFFKVVQDCMVFKGLKGFHEISLGVHSF